MTVLTTHPWTCCRVGGGVETSRHTHLPYLDSAGSTVPPSVVTLSLSHSLTLSLTYELTPVPVKSKGADALRKVFNVKDA